MWTRRQVAVPAPRPARRSQSEFSAGDKVRHEHFGEGIVVSSSGTGGDTQVTVAFAGEGVKRLMLSFAPLVKVEVKARDSERSDESADAEFDVPDPDLFAP
jgi:ribosomal protein L19